MFLERGANLESRAAHTHPKNTQVSPPPRVVNERGSRDEKSMQLNFYRICSISALFKFTLLREPLSDFDVLEKDSAWI